MPTERAVSITAKPGFDSRPYPTKLEITTDGVLSYNGFDGEKLNAQEARAIIAMLQSWLAEQET